MRAILIVGVVLLAGTGSRRTGSAQHGEGTLCVGGLRGGAVRAEQRDGVGAAGVARQTDEYRAFCLYALGRTREAESIAEG